MMPMSGDQEYENYGITVQSVRDSTYLFNNSGTYPALVTSRLSPESWAQAKNFGS